MHGVDYVLYAPTMKSSVECEEQPADDCGAILEPVNNVMRIAVFQNIKKLVVISPAYQESLTGVKSLIAALLEKVVVAQGRFLGEKSKSAILCSRAIQSESLELADFAFENAFNGDLIFKTEAGIQRIPCEHFDLLSSYNDIQLNS